MVTVARTVASGLSTHSQTIHEYNMMPAMDDEQFDRWGELVGSRIGMRTLALRKTFLTNALDKRLLEVNITDYEDYYAYLQTDNKGKLEWIKLIDLLTVKETRFFRHSSSLNLLQEYVREKLSALIENPGTNTDANTAKHSKINSIQAWSIGCATGEEAYTLAMILDQSIKRSDIESCYFGVFASDISQGSLSTARKGLYLASQLKNMEKNLISEYFICRDNNQYQIIDELKKRVCFTKTNVLDIKHSNIGQMDIIFCQNLLIYFEHSTRVSVLNNLVPYLAPNGLLILGAGEIHHWVNSELTLINSENILAYRKIDAPVSANVPVTTPGTIQ